MGKKFVCAFLIVDGPFKQTGVGGKVVFSKVGHLARVH
jgi:hypothetical protein